MEKVVKCINSGCGQYFMLTEKVVKCPFCHTEYSKEVEGKVKDLPVAKQGKKEVVKARKESFRIWKDD